MQTSNIIASVALIISLFSVWLQRRGVREQLLLANISTYTKRYEEIFDRFPKSVLDENFNLASLSEDEQEKLLRTMWIYFNLCYEEYFLYHNLKLIDKNLWKIWNSAMKTAFGRPAFCQCWEVIRNYTICSASFSEFVKEMMESHRS